ncbi:MAG: hypothetical protein Q8P18_00720 [Pseudomonadota bacterium]|nr:hypothetical protein [Pseudomonadota bacterium]
MEETAPRIAMPAPPLRMRAPELDAFDPIVDAPDFDDPTYDDAEDDAPSVGPLQVFVGAPSVDREARGAAGARTRAPFDTSPGMLMTDALDQLEDVFGPRTPVPRVERTEIPGIRVGLSVRGTTEARPPWSPPSAASSPPIVRQRGQGIPTAAARVRLANAASRGGEAPPKSSSEDENTMADVMPYEVFDVPRAPAVAGAPRVPPWDDAGVRRSDRSEISLPGNARVPPRGAPFDGRTGETTNPSQRPGSFGEISGPGAPPSAAVSHPALVAAAPVAAPVAAPAFVASPSVAAVLPTRPPPAPAPPRRVRARPTRRQLLTLALALVLLVGGVAAWRWERANPDAYARLVDRFATRSAPTGGAQASAVVPSAIIAGASPEATIEVAIAAPSDETLAVVPPPVVPTSLAPIPAAPLAPPPAALPAARPLTVAPALRAPVSKAPDIDERRGAFQAATGFLQVLCNRKATVYVDNVRKGSTADLTPLELTAGTHRVKVVANGRTRTMEVRIDAGRTRQVQFELR